MAMNIIRKILDPKSGKVYKCFITLQSKISKVRGYIGFALGRTQYWHRVK
jgi:uncharacterized protein (DUF2147 family)